MSALMLPALPFPLDPTHVPFEVVGEDELRATSQPRTDIFAPPFPGAEPTLNAATLFGTAPEGDFQFSARITVGFRSTFDAGVLMLWHDEEHWAKLCFESAPDGSPTVVSVVNRIVSDDANGQVVKAEHVWMRISRVDGIYAFHSSFDGLRWDMVRLFALESPRPLRIGFEVQSPTGEGCEVVFDQISYSATRLENQRDGS
ncbi:DUF1349 domain-containing protein [Brachybacterium paraconglomeratum]|uniref:DUF1349 domain-containing protein n=1 Tax=Brachybacterium paraconglomeratum TaxID=173362 RepID=UPI0031EDE9A8